MEEISATIGIDMNTATPEQVAKRAYEFALEMADCYEEGDSGIFRIFGSFDRDPDDERREMSESGACTCNPYP